MIIDAEHFRQRLLQDALTEATAAYWERRAATFQAVGTEDCDLTALNCRRHAALLRSLMPEPISDEVLEVLQ